MTTIAKLNRPSRRTLLKSGGALVVSIGAPMPLNLARAAEEARLVGAQPPLTPDQLSSYIAVNADGTISVFSGKTDLGQGLEVALAQMVAEELDVPFNAVKVATGDTGSSVNQGGASSASGIAEGGKQLRAAAAGRAASLSNLRAKNLASPANSCRSMAAWFTAIPKWREASATPNWSAAAISTSRSLGTASSAIRFTRPARQSRKTRRTSSSSANRSNGKTSRRKSLRGNTDIKVPGMVHGRMVRPAVAGAVPVNVDESSIKEIPGARVVWNQGFLGVVADKEWDAIKAARELKVTWSNPAPPFPDQASLYDHIRKAPVRKSETEGKPVGDVDAALKNAARVIEAEYEWPFQSHASMGPACAVVDIKGDQVTVWTGSQKPHFTRDGVAKILGVSTDKVRGIWTLGPGSYGRNDAGDCAMDAALLAKAVGRPVRLQYMRDQATGWDPKAPASIHRARAAIDPSGKVIAYEFMSKAFPRVDVNSNESAPHDTLAGQLTGAPLRSGDGFGVPEESYGFANRRSSWQTIAPLLDRGSPLRTSHLRDPIGPQVHFASESFIDELAAELKVDPVAFRLQYVTDPRDIAVIKAAAEKAGWQPVRLSRRAQNGATVSGRGFAYVQRHGTRLAIVADVEVDRASGKVWSRKFTVAHDCGQIINPDGLMRVIEAGVVQGISRALWEEVKFDTNSVTSVDWLSYPILDIAEAPEAIDVVLIDRPEIPPSGAGEPAIRPVAAAIANAIFDATGVRIRRVPFSPDNVKSALS